MADLFISAALLFRSDRVNVLLLIDSTSFLCSSNCNLLLIYLPRKDERLSRPGWLTYSGQFTHISGHPSAAGRAQDSESTPSSVPVT